MAVRAAEYKLFRNNVLIKQGFVFGQTRFKFIPPNNDPATYTIQFRGGGRLGLPSYVGSMNVSALVLKR